MMQFGIFEKQKILHTEIIKWLFNYFLEDFHFWSKEVNIN